MVYNIFSIMSVQTSVMELMNALKQKHRKFNLAKIILKSFVRWTSTLINNTNRISVCLPSVIWFYGCIIFLSFSLFTFEYLTILFVFKVFFFWVNPPNSVGKFWKNILRILFEVWAELSCFLISLANRNFFKNKYFYTLL
jgi:hypothetical protein